MCKQVKIAPIGTRTRIFSLESGALQACPFPAGTLIVCPAMYLFVHCAHFIALSNPFHYICNINIKIRLYCDPKNESDVSEEQGRSQVCIGGGGQLGPYKFVKKFVRVKSIKHL